MRKSMHWLPINLFQMKISQSSFTYKSNYKIADIVAEINFQTQRDFDHFNYYYEKHKCIKEIDNDIQIYFDTENKQSFVDSMIQREGVKNIFYSLKNSDIALYETFVKSPSKPSIFPPIVFYDDRLALHGSAFGYDNKACILVGTPFAGKSTTLLSLCANKENSFISDDVSIINLENNNVYPFLRPIGLRMNTIKKIEWLQEINIADCILLNIDGHKKVIASPSILPISIQEDPIPLNAIFILKKGDTACKIRNISIPEAFVNIQNNMHIGNMELEKFKEQFQNINFFEVTHDFSDLNLVSKTIKTTIDEH